MFKQLLDNFEALQVAITFAEAGETETALQILQQTEPQPSEKAHSHVAIRTHEAVV